jgi:hypothetical protein
MAKIFFFTGIHFDVNSDGRHLNLNDQSDQE